MGHPETGETCLCQTPISAKYRILLWFNLVLLDACPKDKISYRPVTSNCARCLLQRKMGCVVYEGVLFNQRWGAWCTKMSSSAKDGLRGVRGCFLQQKMGFVVYEDVFFSQRWGARCTRIQRKLIQQAALTTAGAIVWVESWMKVSQSFYTARYSTLIRVQYSRVTEKNFACETTMRN